MYFIALYVPLSRIPRVLFALLQAFMEALSDSIVCQKIADATHIPLDYLQSLSYDQLEGFFDQIDTDMSAFVFESGNQFTEYIF